MVEVELEKTYLAKALPVDLQSCPSEVIRDAYIPASADHPVVRLRQRGKRYEVTKKELISPNDWSRQTEHTISLSKDEFEALSPQDAQTAIKRRYYCTIEGSKAEVDVYLESLKGLVVIDFEFTTDRELEAFRQPELCLADVTEEETIAGGTLAGKTYEMLQPWLEKWGYKPLRLEKRS